LRDIYKPYKKIKKIKWLAPVAVGVVIIIFGLISAAYVKRTVENPNSTDATKKGFSVKQGQSLDEVAKNLEAAKLIKSDFVFSLYMKASKRAKKIQAGDYQIPGNLNMKDVAGIITFGQVSATRITIPEGWTLDQIGDYLEKQKVVKKADFLASAKYQAERDKKYSFLGELKEGDSLEGFLYPDTYELSKDADSNEIITKMLANFEKKFSGLQGKVAGSGMNTYEVVSLASMVEREAVSAADRKMVAGVFEKRLDFGMPLQSDVTVLYALKSTKKDVTYADTQVDSPYNTYRVVGLPAGPICNPSIVAIDAVLNPTKSNYLYFLAAPDGKVYFSTTVDQHNALKAKYLN
jgi:UPF0755 protein